MTTSDDKRLHIIIIIIISMKKGRRELNKFKSYNFERRRRRRRLRRRCLFISRVRSFLYQNSYSILSSRLQLSSLSPSLWSRRLERLHRPTDRERERQTNARANALMLVNLVLARFLFSLTHFGLVCGLAWSNYYCYILTLTTISNSQIIRTISLTENNKNV